MGHTLQGGQRVNRRVGLVGLLALVAALTGPIAGIGVAPAGATTSDVSTSNGFRTAFLDASVDVINLTGDITMSGDCATYTRNTGPLTINGNGFDIDATGCGVQVLQMGGTDDTITFDDVTIEGGANSNSVSIAGGGIQSNGDLVFNDSTIQNNSVTSSATGLNSVSGGGIYVPPSKTVTLTNSTVSGNSATCAACTVSSTGGGISAGTIFLVSSTVTGNSASSVAATDSKGGGLVASTLTMAYSTIVSNTATEAANIRAGAVTSFASLVALPVTGGSCSGIAMTSEGYNYEDDTTCGFGAGTGDIFDGTDPDLGAFGNNGGPTFTFLPNYSSPIIEKIPAADCAATAIPLPDPLTDQRGDSRPRGSGCDIGAVERQGGTFIPTDPTRILDTRSGLGLPVALGPQESRDLQITGVAPVPDLADGVSAVLMNITATSSTANGWLTIFPADEDLPTASNLNFTAGQTVPNLVAVKVASDDGKISINNTGGFAGAGSVHVVGDVVGYYLGSNGLGGGRYVPLATPTRVLDTRENLGLDGAFTPQQERDLDVDGSPAPVPSNATAVVMNVTATAPTAAGWLTVYPKDDPSIIPEASNLNFVAGQTVPNLVTVKLGDDADVTIANTAFPGVPVPSAGTTHVVADVVGYYSEVVSLSSFLTPIAPQRILDTRPSPLNVGGVAGPVAGQATISVDPQTASGLPIAGKYSAALVNVTVTGPTKSGWLSVFSSDDTDPPTASNLNFTPGQTVPNLVKVKVGADGKFKIANTAFPGVPVPSAGTAHIIVDLVGYFYLPS